MSPGLQATILPTHTAQLFQEAVRQATSLLQAGELVALPTETVYGLAANALDTEAVNRIFAAKGRPARNPIIVHVAGIEMARRCAARWPAVADQLAAAFWPGPLTLVLPRSREIPDRVTAGGPTVGIRWPSHPFIQAVIRQCGFPLAAPSANLSNRLSPTNAEHVRKQLGGKIRLIVDGGQSQVGIESTVLDLSVSPPRLLRPGIIHEKALMAVVGELSGTSIQGAEGRQTKKHRQNQMVDGGALKSPGLLPRHYAPKARLLVWSWVDEADLISKCERLVRRAGTRQSRIAAASVHVITHTNIPSPAGFGRVSVIPHDVEAFARALYAELHQCDEAGAEIIIVEAPPQTPPWRAVADRLERASAS